jgi:putative IMPACT (imprinted ancient) family translation regulator
MSREAQTKERSDASNYLQRHTAGNQSQSLIKTYRADHSAADDFESPVRFRRKMYKASLVAVPASALLWALIITGVRAL